MQVYRLASVAELAAYADQWDRLAAGVPFRSWAWASTWWHCYGPALPASDPHRQLHVLAVFDHQDRLVGLGPWYLEPAPARGRVLRMLGSGEVCSDYLSVLCEPGQEHLVAAALAERLCRDAARAGDDALPWDRLELTGIDAEDRPVRCLVEQLLQRGCQLCRRPAARCWRIALPGSWEEYLGKLSKRRRRQFRRLVSDYLESGRVTAHFVQHAEELPRAMDILVELHQRRRKSLGQPGCFASLRFERFLRATAAHLLAAGQLQLVWLALDGKRPLAAEVDLLGGGVMYGYQSGVDPEAMQHQPGNLLMIVLLRWAIGQGYRAYDLLRGDEPYKALMHAEPRPAMALHLIPDRPAARLRHRVWLAGANLKQWLQKSSPPAGVAAVADIPLHD